MMKELKATVLAALLLLCLGCSGRKEPVDYVNPYMGNISHLLVPTYPTVHLPNAMMRVYPERADYTGDRVKGLPMIVTSHRGKSAFNLSFTQGPASEARKVYKYHYDLEQVRPYEYSVYFEEEEVSADFAPSRHSAIYELRFEASGTPSLVFNTDQGSLNWEDGAVKGFQTIDGRTNVYLYAVLSEPVQACRIETSGKGNYLVLTLPDNCRTVSVRYGVSFIDVARAEANLQAEIPAFDLKKTAAEGRRIWNETLGKIRIEGMDETQKTVFYTSLYRTCERMVCISEGDRYFSAFDGKVHQDERPFYTDDWVWDTYRAAHPLRMLIEPVKESDMIYSFERMSEQLEPHWMPTFPEVTGDSRRMNSNHGVAIVADAMAKGLQGFDAAALYRYCKAGITEKTLAPWSGVKGGGLTAYYWENGYIPALREGQEETCAEVHPFERRQPVAVSLGTAYDQWCLGVMAHSLGLEEDAARFDEGSLNYRKIWNSDTRFFHPRDDRGAFLESFDYVRSGGIGARNAYDENNGWIYRWDVQHNVADLVSLMGGPEAFVCELDRMFDMPLGASKFDFYSQLPDHTGNVGQFSMANEPSFHIPYLYNYAGTPWKTQKRIRTLLDQWYRNDLMGVPGDEDGGGMSAFVVFSMLGFYPVTPGLPVYNIGSPVFRRARIDLGDGKTFEVLARNYAPGRKYIQSARLNGEALDRCWFTHEELMRGGSLELTMGDKPRKDWGVSVPPPSFVMKP